MQYSLGGYYSLGGEGFQEPLKMKVEAAAAAAATLHARTPALPTNSNSDGGAASSSFPNPRGDSWPSQQPPTQHSLQQQQQQQQQPGRAFVSIATPQTPLMAAATGVGAVSESKEFPTVSLRPPPPTGGDASCVQWSREVRRSLCGEDPGQPLRKACDFCTKRKRKCDGGQPCSFCVELKTDCVYSARLKSGRKKKPSVETERGVTSLTENLRSFSASPAVGLVGYLENVFLMAFMNDFNKGIPITGSLARCTVEALTPMSPSEATAATLQLVDPNCPKHGRLALFWAAVALGSRIMGAGLMQTDTYMRLSRSSLKECFDYASVDVLRAYTLISVVEAAMGRSTASQRYLQFAEIVYRSMLASNELDASDRVSLKIVIEFLGAGTMCITDIPDEQECSGALKFVRQLVLARETVHKAFTADPQPCDQQVKTIFDFTCLLDTVADTYDLLQLESCLATRVFTAIWKGLALVFKGQLEAGLQEVNEGVSFALARPGLIPLRMWQHALHVAALVYRQCDLEGPYNGLRSTYNVAIPQKEVPLPEFGKVSQSSICSWKGSPCKSLCRFFEYCRANGIDSTTYAKHYAYAEQGFTGGYATVVEPEIIPVNRNSSLLNLHEDSDAASLLMNHAETLPDHGADYDLWDCFGELLETVSTTKAGC
jgi:hypothetical protein